MTTTFSSGERAESDIALLPQQSHRRHQPPNQYGTVVSYPNTVTLLTQIVLDAGIHHPHNEGE